jgi:hypothetical protein
MFAEIAVFFALGLGAVGLGIPVMRFFAPSIGRSEPLRLGLSGTVGLFVAASVAAFANIFIPVGPVVAIPLAAFGLASVVLQMGRLSAYSLTWYFILVIVVARLSTTLLAGYDGGLYHLPHQYWIATDKLVFGLANLHNRFGFNSINEYLLALGWFGEANLSLLPLIAGLFSLFFLLAIAESIRADGADPRMAYVLSMSIIGYMWLHWIFATGNGWTNTDVPTAICVLLCAYCGFMAATRDNPDYLMLSYLFAGFAAALKLSGALVVLFPLGLTIERLRHGRIGISPVRFVLLGCAFLPWLLTSVAVSGCFAYPVSATCLRVPWEASATADNVSGWIKAWARAPRTGLRHVVGWEWLPLWFGRVWIDLAVWGAISALGLVMSYFLIAARGVTRNDRAPVIVFATYALIAIAVWFLTAPEPRFGAGHMVCLAMVPGLILLTVGKAASAPRWPARWIPASLLIASLMISFAYSWRASKRDWLAFVSWSAPGFPEVPTKIDGMIRRPAVGDQCFLVLPPCSPYGVSREETWSRYRAYFAPGKAPAQK